MKKTALTDQQKLIYAGLLCPYCFNPSELVDDVEIYGRSFGGKAYRCKPCQAHVGCHKGTSDALGRLADANLRIWKKKAHDAFDRLWKNGPGRKMNRKEAYAWLSEQLGIHLDYTHIGFFGVKTCQKVVEICEAKK